ncbi:ABC transporter ATP-binding protein [Nocardioides sp. LHD-245]|uniref:ABC transporter ATP-binding protein n=1 Tax=Nocardioides sp. LHD-245 TaxID=3051387 RepID=UPI0027E15F65|nr:ABC transporter ATP-binding protein [Nocardioides sp. LHD-245]
MPETPLLQIEDLVVEFPTRGGLVRAVDGVSLTLGRGERLGIVGESGSGKSVLGRTVMGLNDRARARISGRVLFEGKDVLGASAQERRELWGRQISMIFQDPLSALHPITPIGAQIAEAVRRLPDVDKAQAAERAVELLDMVGIPDARRRARQRAHEFSGGMRQRALIAMAIACKPKLIIADEPTTALDVTVQAKILDLLDELCTELSIGSVLITHDMGVVAQHTDRVAVMYGGQVVETAPVAGLFAAPTMRYTRALLAAIPQMAPGRRSLPVPIGGTPPNPLERGAGCRFAPRCTFAEDDCHQAIPELLALADATDHRYRCWHPAAVPAETEAGAR